MSVMACLRVEVSGTCARAPASELGPIVQKIASVYLETFWTDPRSASPLPDGVFQLVDPDAREIDWDELRPLADELQSHLFGSGGEGEVALLVFEGSQRAVAAFAALDAQAAAGGVEDPRGLPPGGRLTRVVAEGPDAAARAADAALKRELTEGPPPAAPPAWEGVQGIYFTLREVFFGDVVTCVPAHARTHVSLVDGPDYLPRDAAAFDAACVKIAARLLAERARGPLLYLPICFTSLVRPAMREAYLAMLADLPTDRRAELAAAVYDVPRDPAFTSLRQARELLEPYVSAIDLRITDPGFEIEKLAPGAATSVTLMLPDGDAHQRLSVLRRFGERLTYYKQRRVWPGVTNVRRRAEIDAAIRLQIPFVTGPAVCTPAQNPVGGRAVALANLPLTQRDDAIAQSQVA